jgi:transcriptional regulator with XRE-family HTH domain
MRNSEDIRRVRLKPNVRAMLVLATEDENFSDIANRAGVSRNWLSRVYNNHTITCRIEYAAKLAKALGTTLEVISTPATQGYEFGQTLRRLRRYKHVSLKDLAKVMGVHESKLSRIEKGVFQPRLTVDQIESAVEALKLTKDDADALMEAWAPLDLE